jgi:hypothetical protein
MLYAFRLGPVETDEGDVMTYVGMTPDEALPPLFAERPTEALKSLADQAEGHELRCETSLARAGKALGFEPAKPPAWVAVPRALLAFGLALGNASAGLHGGPAEEFLAASAAFMKAKPWRHWDNRDVVDIAVSGLRNKQYEASIMGSGGEEYGVALYEEKGAIEKLARLFEQGRIAEAASLRSIAVTMDDEPIWAVKAMKDAFGLARLPVPIKVARGAPGPVDIVDLATLAAALRAVSHLTPRRLEAAGRLEVHGGPKTLGGKLVASARMRIRPFV